MNLVAQRIGGFFKGGYARLAFMLVMALVVATSASAQTAGDWDISGAQATVTGLLVVGTAITIALVIFKLGKRGANKV